MFAVCPDSSVLRHDLVAVLDLSEDFQDIFPVLRSANSVDANAEFTL